MEETLVTCYILTIESIMTSTIDQKFVDVLLKQNAELEKLVKKLCTDLEDTTSGILMRGYLYKFRDRVISFQAK